MKSVIAHTTKMSKEEANSFKAKNQ